MTVSGLMTVPLLAALLVWILKGRLLRTILLSAAAVHTVLTGYVYFKGEESIVLRGIELGCSVREFGFGVLAITSLLFLLVSLHLCSWLKSDARAGELRGESHGMSKHTLVSLLLLFLGTMTLTALAQDFGTLWVAVEATTLASAPLINFHRSKTSLEAMWKYLLLCSLGIGMALLGTMLLSAALPEGSSLAFDAVKNADPQWFKAAFVFCFAGYGLKTGLAPFHSWLPDAHSEAPAPVSALLSGSLLNCALLGLVNIRDAAPEGLTGFCNGFFICFGIISLLFAAFFIIGQKDFKRMLAYSSVEHMGLAVLMIGFDCGVLVLLHMAFHSLTKMMLFLTAGNILLAYGTRKIEAVTGVLTRLPRNGMLWLAGMLLICGTPPSPLFFTELVLVKQAGILWGGVILLLLLIIFCAMAYVVIKMCMGSAAAAEFPEIDCRAEKLTRIPLLVLMLIIFSGAALMAETIMRYVQ
ncbi:MAG: NADH dehydrogenase FAD-containing subunit [Lentisphaeria bacterium]|nr:NADH dehydrogenase FAD-containing subunit [Lentisphaeria bacterium]